MATRVDQLVTGAIVAGPLLPEPVEVLATMPMGRSIKLLGRGIRTNQVHQPVLDAEQVVQISGDPHDQDPVRLGWKAVVRVEHYHATPATLLAGETQDERRRPT